MLFRLGATFTQYPVKQTRPRSLAIADAEVHAIKFKRAFAIGEEEKRERDHGQDHGQSQKYRYEALHLSRRSSQMVEASLFRLVDHHHRRPVLDLLSFAGEGGEVVVAVAVEHEAVVGVFAGGPEAEGVGEVPGVDLAGAGAVGEVDGEEIGVVA